ncbi:hypothetical protein LQG66_01195 [Bradyrhizobium ontarionense]|uniref:Uncharacterized protein n=1 Tax=Bradyrhizobium ontarionense TaxID=2898149 RepID=A0ABY3RCA0_9BRAD|nr:hypothetical protein [Bradyrhizobium sp. A19]UFZ04966.1 hypothetical protein LQG66_01195 [Bradyrhizobium sp. A19]
MGADRPDRRATFVVLAKVFASRYARIIVLLALDAQGDVCEGDGLSRPLLSFSFSLDTVRIRFISQRMHVPEYSQGWQFAERHPVDDWALAIAVRQTIRLDLRAMAADEISDLATSRACGGVPRALGIAAPGLAANIIAADVASVTPMTRLTAAASRTVSINPGRSMMCRSAVVSGKAQPFGAVAGSCSTGRANLCQMIMAPSAARNNAAAEITTYSHDHSLSRAAATRGPSTRPS